MSEAMSNAVVAHINGTAPFLEVDGQEKQVSIQDMCGFQEHGSIPFCYSAGCDPSVSC
jgi:hypothetical protein